MGDRVRLGVLIPQFPGQTHIFFWREIAELEKRGVEVRLISTRLPPRGLISHDWSEAAIQRTQYLGGPDVGGTLAGLVHLPLREVMKEPGAGHVALLRDNLGCLAPARRLARICERDQIEHLHAHSCGRSAIIARLAHQMSGVPYSLTLHGPLRDYGGGQRMKWRRAAFVTVITKKLLAEARAELGDAVPGTVIVQGMGVDTDFLVRHAPYAPARSGEPLRLFSCGRLNPVKGHQDLLRAVQILVGQRHDVRLEIAGEDDDGGSGFRKVLEADIDKLHLSGRVVLRGAIDAGAVRRGLLDAHVFVLASWNEPLGVAYMEAMSCGVPTIGTDAGGVRELIDESCGVLVPPRDPVALARAIAELVQDPDRAVTLAAAGRARVVDRFGAGLGAETLIRLVTQANPT